MITFKANPYQEQFIKSSSRYPCLAAAWATGKTLSAISRAELYSRLIPENLGCIFRKTARSLNDSTLQDYQKYTGNKVNADRNFVYSNGSMIMFRHLDEIQSINQQNINLGWFYIEQGEELDSDKEFWMLIGRLRRDIKPSEAFLKLGMAPRSGWVIANSGDNWIRKNWLDHPFDGSELIQATTWDNKHNLPQDFLDSLKVLEKQSPILYKQFVLNNWDIASVNKVFPKVLIEHCYSRHELIASHAHNIGVAVDPAGMGVDDNVFAAGNGGEVFEWYEKTIMSPVEKAIKAVEMCKKINGWFIVVDCDGLGIEMYQELLRLPMDFTNGIQMIKFHGSAPSEIELAGRPMYANMRAEAAFIAQQRAYQGLASIDPRDTKLVEDLEQDTSYTNSRGLQQLILKDDIKKIIKRSPGKGDAWKMLQWAFNKNIVNQRLIKNPIFNDDRHMECVGRTNLPAYGVQE